MLTKACTLRKNQLRNMDPISQSLVLSQILIAIKCRRNPVSQGSCTTSLGYSSGPHRRVIAIENWSSFFSPLALALFPPTPSIPPMQWLPSHFRGSHTLSSSTYGTFSRIHHILSLRTNLNKFKRIKIISNIYFEHPSMKLQEEKWENHKHM